MAKINTLEKLETKLDKDLSWRKKELTLLKSELNMSESEQIIKTRIRTCVALLYAHWEGFVKNSSNYYMEYISNLSLPVNNYNSNFLAIYFDDLFKKCKESEKPSFKNDLVKKIIEFDSIEDQFNTEVIVNTKSNLNIEQLNIISDFIGIDLSSLNMDKIIIDEKLLNWRNNIAHGSQVQIDVEDYNLIHNYVLSKMDEYSSLLKVYSNNKLFLQEKFRA